jgi:hypothetical protein
MTGILEALLVGALIVAVPFVDGAVRRYRERRAARAAMRRQHHMADRPRLNR